MLRNFSKLIYFGIGIIVSTLIFEGVLRFVEMTPLWKVFPVAEGTFYGPDPKAGYTLRPGATGVWVQENREKHTVNSHGMLDYNRDVQKKTFRVAVIGDSMTEALQVDRASTFTKKAQDILIARGLKAEFLNFGLAGATPAVMAARLEAHAIKFSPDLTVIIVSIGDFLSSAMGDDSEFAAYVFKNGSYIRGDSFKETPGYRFRISSVGQFAYSQLATWRVLSILNSRKNAGLFAEIKAFKTGGNKNAPSVDVGQECVGEPINGFKKLWSDKLPEDAWQRATAFVSDLKHQRDRIKTEIVVAIMGLGGRCEPEASTRAEILFKLNEAFEPIRVFDLDTMVTAQLPSDFPKKNLAGFGTQMGWGHLNYFGHEIYGNAISQIVAPHAKNYNEQN